MTLPDDMVAFIEARMQEEGHASVSEYIQALIRRAAKRMLEAKFQEALDSGPATPMTREDWKLLEDKVWERQRRDQGQS